MCISKSLLSYGKYPNGLERYYKHHHINIMMARRRSLKRVYYTKYSHTYAVYNVHINRVCEHVFQNLFIMCCFFFITWFDARRIFFAKRNKKFFRFVKWLLLCRWYLVTIVEFSIENFTDLILWGTSLVVSFTLIGILRLRRMSIDSKYFSDWEFMQKQEFYRKDILNNNDKLTLNVYWHLLHFSMALKQWDIE